MLHEKLRLVVSLPLGVCPSFFLHVLTELRISTIIPIVLLVEARDENAKQADNATKSQLSGDEPTVRCSFVGI